MSVFRPAKRIWRKLLDNWRKETKRKGSIPKNNFPSMLKELCEKLSGVNLVSGFRATGLHCLDRQQVLKRLPGSSRDPGGEKTNDILNDSVMNLLRNYFGAGSTNRRGSNQCGKRIVPGRPITNDQPSCSYSHQETDASTPSTTVAQRRDDLPTHTDAIWTCSECQDPWDEEGDDRGIVCDNCSKQFHLQCSEVQYRRKDYYTIDIESMSFICEECS